MSQQLSCHDMCKIVAWSDHYFSSKSDLIFFTRFQLWAHEPFVKRVPEYMWDEDESCIYYHKIPYGCPLGIDKWVLGGGHLTDFLPSIISPFLRNIKTLITCWLLHSYLAGVTAAQLQWHLPNMNVGQQI